MLMKIIFILIMGLASSAFAGEHSKIDSLGDSKAGQFVALEEYGYLPSINSYYVSIKIINVFNSEYVGTPIFVTEKADRPFYLKAARLRARQLATPDLLKFKIRG